ncbi:MAG TPA: hypothetical protein DGG94_14505 [Micromonosporaceae bacterium]|nr:hypothetical protein [Micromonosporaceae bacterium]
MDEQPKDRQQKRKIVDALLLQDLADEIADECAAAGGSPDHLWQWIPEHWTEDLRAAPATGLSVRCCTIGTQQRHQVFVYGRTHFTYPSVRVRTGSDSATFSSTRQTGG